MKLAVLGTDPDLIALLASAIADGHEVVWLSDVRAQDETALRRLTAARVEPSSAWETLLDHATADAVLIGRGNAQEDLRTEQLKRLVADAIPLLVVHPSVPSLLTYYELDMVRRDTGAILRHYNPSIGHPSLSDLERWIREGHESIGNVVQVSCTRDMAENSREAVLAGLARDVELLALVAGNIHHVSAAGPHDTSASYASLQVQMTASIPAALRWSVVPKLRPTDRIELTLVGERGSITWSQQTSDNSAEPELERRLALSTQEEPLTIPPFDAPLTAIRQLQAAISKGDTRKNAASSTWAKATQAMEIVDAIELSLQKGRTIEVQQQKLTEQLAFRGTMAALGCGLLLLSILVAFIVGIVGGIESVLRQPVFRIWAPLLLAVLAVFLLLQVVPYLAPKRRNQETDETDNSSE